MCSFACIQLAIPPACPFHRLTTEHHDPKKRNDSTFILDRVYRESDYLQRVYVLLCVSVSCLHLPVCKYIHIYTYNLFICTIPSLNSPITPPSKKKTNSYHLLQRVNRLEYPTPEDEANEAQASAPLPSTTEESEPPSLLQQQPPMNGQGGRESVETLPTQDPNSPTATAAAASAAAAAAEGEGASPPVIPPGAGEGKGQGQGIRKTARCVCCVYCL